MKNKPYYEIGDLKRADFLVKSANILGLTYYDAIVKAYPKAEIIEKYVLFEYWTEIITLAGVGCAFAEIVDLIQDEEQKGMCYAIQKSLEDWKVGSYEKTMLFIDSVNQFMDKGLEIETAIGLTIWFNLRSQSNDNEYIKELSSNGNLVKIMGFTILKTFHRWWEKD